MKTWTETLTLAALAVLFTLAACGPGNVGNVTPDIDEEAVATVQAEVEGWIIARTTPSFGPPQPIQQRTADPDIDEEKIRDYAKGNDPSAGLWYNPIPLNEAEIEFLLDRMRAKKAARREAGIEYDDDGFPVGAPGGLK